MFAPSNPDTTDYDELAETLTWLPVLEGWAKSVREFAYNAANRGVSIPKHKLVAKRAQRRWDPDSDRETVIKYLEAQGFSDWKTVVKPVELITPTQMEKVLKKDNEELFSQVADTFVVKESSGNTLVPSSDKRKEVTPQTAQDVFK